MLSEYQELSLLSVVSGTSRPIRQLTWKDGIGADLRDLFQCILTPSEFLLWEDNWSKLLRSLLSELKNSTEGLLDEDGNFIILERLSGTGRWVDPDEQACVLPKYTMTRLGEVVVKAFYQLPELKPKGSYINIKQSPSESFLQFIEQLCEQVERQIEDPTVQTEMLQKMAQNNVNVAWRWVILVLPVDPPPTLTQIIAACTKKGDLYRGEETSSSKAKNSSCSYTWTTQTTTACTSKVFQPCKPIRLVTVKAYHFRSTHWTVVLIDLEKDSTCQTEQTTGQDKNCEYFVIGDTTHTPSETEITPATLKGGLTDLILLAHCPQPPFYLAKGQIIAQAIPIPTGVPVDDKSPDVYWAEVVGEDKPIMGCNLTHGTKHLHVNGLLDIGADVRGYGCHIGNCNPWLAKSTV
ncbi:hypothetical protein DUI87_28454 [Hirundo rustica rustica]|uniref:Retroviral nucleocapsid Gag protein p24 C-terminal domain-containing protein n=1 Tax=Hirundo rustica rustica TaxID=333673 RepID=A0A3M0J8B5_HIRRU|nr:hypothetical protein DUI87_28454 [Hirundo rustica rustica]